MSALLTQRPRAGHRPPAYSALDPEADRPVVALSVATSPDWWVGLATHHVRRTAAAVVTVYNHPAVTVAAILGTERRAIIAEARFITWWVLRSTVRLSEQEIAFEFGRHRSTISHGFSRLHKLMSVDESVKANVSAVEMAMASPKDAAKGLVEWFTDPANLPDDERTVLIALAGGEVWMGYRDSGIWVTVEGSAPVAEVIGWAELPAGPSAEKAA